MTVTAQEAASHDKLPEVRQRRLDRPIGRAGNHQLIQPEGKQAPRALRVHPASARTRSGTGPKSMASTGCSAWTRSR